MNNLGPPPPALGPHIVCIAWQDTRLVLLCAAIFARQWAIRSGIVGGESSWRPGTQKPARRKVGSMLRDAHHPTRSFCRLRLARMVQTLGQIPVTRIVRRPC